MWQSVLLSYPRNGSPNQLHLPVCHYSSLSRSGYAHLFSFLLGFWVFYLLLCPRLHLKFHNNPCSSYNWNFFFFFLNAAVIWQSIYKISWIPTCCAINTQSPTCMSTACQLGLRMQLFEQLPRNRDSQGNKVEYTSTNRVNTYGRSTSLWQPVNTAAGGSICQSGWGHFFPF